MATPIGAIMLSSKVEEETIDYEPNVEDYFGAEAPPPHQVKKSPLLVSMTSESLETMVVSLGVEGSASVEKLTRKRKEEMAVIRVFEAEDLEFVCRAKVGLHRFVPKLWVARSRITRSR